MLPLVCVFTLILYFTSWGVIIHSFIYSFIHLFMVGLLSLMQSRIAALIHPLTTLPLHPCFSFSLGYGVGNLSMWDIYSGQCSCTKINCGVWFRLHSPIYVQTKGRNEHQNWWHTFCCYLNAKLTGQHAILLSLTVAAFRPIPKGLGSRLQYYLQNLMMLFHFHKGGCWI